MLAKKIYNLRRQHGWSQEQLAARIGVSRQAISKWEGGLATPELDKLLALSECFSVSIDELAKDELSLSQTATNITDPRSQCSVTAGQKTGQKGDQKIGQKAGQKTVLWLCILGVVGLVVVGIIMLVAHSTAEHINTSSVITLNGTGILTLLFIILVGMGVFLLLKNK